MRKYTLLWHNNVSSTFFRLVFAQLLRTETRLKSLWLTEFRLKTEKMVFEVRCDNLAQEKQKLVFEVRCDNLAQEKQKLVLEVRKVDFGV